MGTNIVHGGKAGSGQHAKMANQIAIAAGMIGVCEAISYAKHAGLDMAYKLYKQMEDLGAGLSGTQALYQLFE